ncbi:MAG: murein biosynthesis integral membrane protein MurJ [Holosporales bacterium]|jgi:putative peptidoglycan lipid II flippase|nr:murein biosynthesis integral membrane protein MurJ [Holosporales bacterium]
MKNFKKSLIFEKNHPFIRAFFVFSSWTSISRIFGVIREILLANIFGASAFSDIYAFATKLPNFFRKFFAEGALNAVIVPKISGLIAQNDEENAFKLAQKMFSVLAIFLLIFVVIFEIGMPIVVNIVALGFKKNNELYNNVIYFSRLTFPYIWLISITALMSSIMNSFNHFSWSAANPIILNIAITIALVIGKVFEGKISLNTVMHYICFSFLFGGILQCLALWFNCKKNGIKLAFTKPQLTQEIKDIFKATIPGIIGAGVMQINIFIDLAFASLLPEGSVSYLNYADRINQLPLSLFGASLGISLLPSLSKYIGHNQQKALEIQNNAIVFGMLFVMPATVGIFVLAKPIISLLYGHGRFDNYAILQTMLALKAFACGLPAYVLVKIFSAIFFANKDTKTPVKFAAICVLLNAVLNYIFRKYYAHVGIAAATAISSTINAILCIVFLFKKRKFCFTKKHIYKIFKITISSILMGVILNFILLNFSNASGTILQLLYMFMYVIIGFIIYLILIFLFEKINIS